MNKTAPEGRKPYINVILFLFLTAALITAAIPLQRRISERLEILKKESVAYIEDLFGRSISYDSIAPSIFRYIEIRGLRIHSLQDSAVPLLSISRIRVFYRLGELLKGGGAAALREIRIENSSFLFDLEEDSDIFELFTPEGTGTSTFPDITISGKNLTLEVESDKGRIRLEKFFFELNPAGELLKVQGKCNGSAFADPAPFDIDSLQAVVRISGVVCRDFSESELRIKLAEVYSPMFELSAITLYAGHTGKKVTLRKIQDKAPFNILVGYDFEQQKADIAFSAEDFVPYTYLTPGEGLSDIAPWFTSVISGTAEAEYSIEEKEVNYDMDLHLRLDNRLLPAAFSLDLDMYGDLTRVMCRNVKIASVYGVWNFQGSVSVQKPFPVPEGTLRIRNVPVGDAAVNSIMTIEQKDPFVRIHSNSTEVGEITLRNTVIDLIPYKDDIDFLITTFLDEESGKPLFSGEGNLQIRPDLFIQASAAIEALPMAPAAALFSEDTRLEKISESLVFSTHVFLSTDFDRFSFTTSDVQFLDLEVPGNRASLSLTGNNSGFSLDNIQVTWGESHLSGNASIDITEKNGFSADMSFVFRDIPYRMSAAWNPVKGFLIDGNYGITAVLKPEDSTFLFSLSCENLPIPLEDSIGYLTLRTDGVYEASDAWDMFIRQCIITGLPLPVRENRLSISGKADQDRLVLYRVAYTDSISSVSGSGVLDTSLISASGNGWLEMADAKNSERYVIQFSRDETINAEVYVSRAPIGRFTTGEISGRAGGRVLIFGNPENPEIELDAVVESGLFNGDPFSGTVRAQYDGTILSCSDFDLRFMNNSLDNTSFEYNLATGAFTGRGSIRGAMQSEIIGARLGIAGNTTPTASILDVPSVLEEYIEGTLVIDRIMKGQTALDPWSLAFISEKDTFHVEGGPETSLTADIFADNTFELVLAAPLPIRGTARGVLEKSTVEADITDVGLDVKILDTIMRLPQFRFLEGEAEGYLKIAGSFNDPEIWGTLNVTNIMAENPYVQEKIGPFDATLEFDEKTLSIRNTVLPAGKAKAVADVTFNIDHWITDTLEIDLQTLSKEGIHVVNSFGRMNVDGYVRGHLNIRGDPNIIDLTGSLEALSTIVTIRNPEEEGLRSGGLNKFLSADVELITGKGVEFLWPSRSLPVLRTFAETGERVRVTYDSTKDQYTIRGEAGIKGGQIYYVQRNFYIREGMIIFNENQDKFDPILSATAEIREITPEGDSAKIFLIVEENALSTFQPRFESEPPMATAEIFSILGGQMFYASGAEGMDISQALALTSDFVGQFGLLRSFEERVKSIFNIDLFTIRTPVVSNILLEKVLPAQSEDGYSEPETLGKYLDNTTLFLGKYFGNDLFLQAILRLDFYDQLSGRIDSSNDMYVDTEITLEWKTPITLVEFSLFPDLTADETGQIFNPSLGLSWRYSY